MNDEEEIMALLKMIDIQIKHRADQCFQEYGLTSGQAWYILYICEHSGTLGQKELAEHFHVSHPTVVGIINRLEEKGFVSSTADPEDRRSRILHCTPTAWHFAHRMQQGRQEISENVMHGFTVDQKRELSDLLKKINCNLNEVNDEKQKQTK